MSKRKVRKRIAELERPRGNIPPATDDNAPVSREALAILHRLTGYPVG